MLSKDDEPLLDLLDVGSIRRAVELGATDPRDGAAQLVTRAWGRVGAGRPAEAWTLLRPLVERLEPLGRSRAFAHALLALGVASVIGADVDRGTALLERALPLHERPWPRAQALRFLAHAMELRGEWEAAVARYLEAAAVYDTIGDAFGAGNARYGAASACAEVEDDARARALLEQAVEQLRSLPPVPALGSSLAWMASLVVHEEPERAKALLEEAERYTEDAPGLYYADLLVRRGEVLLALGDARGAQAAVADVHRLAGPDAVERPLADHVAIKALLARREWRRAAAALAAAVDPAAFTGARLERCALRFRLAAHAGSLAEVDAAAAELDTALRARWRRRGTAGQLVDGAHALISRSPDRAARAFALAVAFGADVEALLPTLRGLRPRLNRIPLGPLWLRRPIGKGGMGEVWQAAHEDGTAVAVKLLRVEATADVRSTLFSAEVEAIARLDHPAIVRVLAALPVDPVAAVLLERPARTPALVLELVRGGALDRRPPASWAEAKPILAGLLDALAHAHARGVLHLDLKPANVLLDDTAAGPSPRLTDFGLAGLVRCGDEVFGTPAYMAPEQGERGAALGPAADLYGFGCLAWRLLAGMPVHGLVGEREHLERHRFAALPRFRPAFPVPEGTEEWLRGLLARHPDDRVACAADAAAGLAALGEPVGEHAVLPAFEENATLDLAAATGPTSATTRPLAVRDDGAPAGPRATTAPPRVRVPEDWRGEAATAARPFLPGAGEGLFHLRSGRLVARDAERDALWSALRAVDADRRGRARFLVSADGLGRSALLRWFGETAAQVGAARVVRDVPLPQLDTAVRSTPHDRVTLVLVDDAGEDALDVVRALADTPSLVVVATRELLAVDPDELLVLEPLPTFAIAALVDDLLPLERGLALRLAERAGGSPAFAVALLGELLRRDVLDPGPEGFRPRPGTTLVLPESLRGLWAGRLDARAPIGSPRRRAWELAAVLGPSVPREVWLRAVAALGVPDASGELAAEGWLVATGDELRFRDPAAAEALRDGAEGAGRAQALHSAAADAMVDHPALEARRARHLAMAGRHAEALAPLRRAAADAVNSAEIDACRALIMLWERSADALGIAADDPRRASPIVVRAHLALHTGEDPVPLLERGLALVRGGAPDVECQLTYTQAWVLARDGRDREALPLYARALALAEELGERVLGVVILLAYAASRYALGEDATAMVDDARARLAGGLVGLAIRLDACAGRGLLRLGRPDEALVHLHAAVDGAAAARSPEVEADALSDLADLAADAGELDEALRWSARAVAVLGATGSDKAFVVAVRRAGLELVAGDDAAARDGVRTLRLRYGWRLRPEVAAEVALVELGLAGGPASGLPALVAALGRHVDEPGVRRTLAEVRRRVGGA